MAGSVKYRRDIDGMRALAVLPVVLFHAGYSWLPGGFVGVDVFFVISGYLICSIILKEMEQQQFSFRRFYARRVRRILPVLLVVLSVTLVAGYFFLLPNEYMNLVEAALATLTFVPNIYFELTASTYFGLDIATQPLMHTWSLGIEEQFYILFPALLLLLHRRFSRNTMRVVLISILVLSLIANILLAQNFTFFTFYIPQTRAWELLAGVMLAIGVVPEIRNHIVANLAGLSGLVLILGTMLLLNERDVFPGINAVYPVLGSVLLIHSGTHATTAVSWLLSRRLPVWIGLISYSLYLWHWPVSVYVNMVSDSQSSRLFVVALSAILAALSYRYVESRYRKPQVSRPSRRLSGELAAIGLVVMVGAGVVLGEDGLVERIPDSAWQAVATEHAGDELQSCRQFSENERGKLGEKGMFCRLGEKDGQPSFVVLGDSHAEALLPSVQLAALKTGSSGYSISLGGCRTLAGVFRKHKKKCLYYNNAALRLVRSMPSIKKVFIVGYWRIPLTGEGYDNKNYLIMDTQTRIQSPEENRRVFEQGLQRTMELLKDREVIVVQDIPEIGSQFGKSITNHFVRQAWLGTSRSTAYEYKLTTDRYESMFDDIISKLPANGRYLKIRPWLCHSDTCPLLIDGKLAYRDGDHLSYNGALLLVPALLPFLQTDVHTLI